MNKNRELNALTDQLSRRTILKLGSIGTAAWLAGDLAGCHSEIGVINDAQSNRIEVGNSPLAPGLTLSKVPDLELALTAVEDTVNIVPGQPAQVWRYVGEVIQGNPNALSNVEDSYLGPTIRAQQGQHVRIHFTNELPVPSGIHWHGLLVPEHMDGHPRDHIGPGESYTYEFEVRNRAGTYWYHPHPDRTTGGQVYRGLAGLFLITTEEEIALALPRDAQDIPLVLQDRIFDERGQLVYGGNDPVLGATSEAFYGNGHTQSMGMSGNRILVNGQTDYILSATTRAHRLRILNGSNSRTYVLGWNDRRPLTIIGTDGGLLETPVERDYVILGPAERIELWADFSTDLVGDRLALISYSLGSGDPFLVARIVINGTVDITESLPKQLTRFVPLALDEAVNRETPRQFHLNTNQQGWAINGRTFELEAVADDERVQFGATEVWEFINEAGGMLMPHPMHIHGVQFRVIERRMEGADEARWASIRAGYVDEGWKDTVMVMPGERTQVLMRFDAYPGLFLMHCHVLEHEDMRMMRNFRVDLGV